MRNKDTVINIRVSKSFKQRIMEAIHGRSDYTVTKVLIEGAEHVLKQLAKGQIVDRR